MFNTDKYFDFDLEKKTEAKSNKKKKQQQQALLLLLLAAGAAYYYFMIYLPDEERKALEKQIQNKLEEVKNLKTEEYNNIPTLLIACQDYLKWATGTEPQKLALKKKKEVLDSAIKWLEEHQKTPEEIEAEITQEHFKKGRIWKLPASSWADQEVRKLANILVGRYQEDTKAFPDGDKNEDFRFTRAASYDIYFPPSLQNIWEKTQLLNHTNCKQLTKNEDLIWSEEISAWYKQVMSKIPPSRGSPDPTTKRDNNAIFYGAAGTGKSATAKKICIEANSCPLVIVKGSSLTPTKQDYDAGIAPLQKFIYTISELEWTLESYGLERKGNDKNQEISYILFVDECDQISNNSLIHDPNKLRFLKECLEGSDSSREYETNNLWIFATNHLQDIEKAAYREGRLSNPLDFSWTWTEFKKYFDDARINPWKYIERKDFPTVNISDMPSRWRETNTLNEDDNKEVNKFNKFTFVADFLGYDPQKPGKPKFWETFINANPDGEYETEEDEVNDDNEPTGEKEKIEIEVGEFLQFFWQKKESGQLGSYDGEFESPRVPKVEEVLDNSLPEIPQLLAQSSNELNQSLENLRQEIEALNQQMQLSAMNNPANLQNSISDLYKLVGELRGKIDK
ncbi:MAG: hypothetical protein MRERV_4c057 [Mycoplasmataceae bacterium RV_VA103A]|nr:MAG: hypothetical protein MRERV_11c018 [Mycoplasmataceae bacterium RV_VA103A]KLL05161.1 MAG: hypothetical protein MRERV_4c057 [Mycoplasmataceae bacterium RV_VA103A]